jgi:hypothetical protein
MVDSLKIYEFLKSADLPEPQARAIVKALGAALEDSTLELRNLLAVKVDSPRFEKDMLQMETSVLQELSGLRTDLSKVDLKIEAAMERLKFELLRWMFVFWAGQVAATVAIIVSANRILK